MKQQSPAIKIVPIYPDKPDIERVLRGFMIVLGLNQKEIERRLKQRRIELQEGQK